MKTDLRLSRLAFECIRDSLVLPNDNSFSYDSFISGKYKNIDTDWSLQTRMAFPTINLAIARLIQYDKIPLKVTELEVTKTSNSLGGYDYYVEKPDDADEIRNVYLPVDNGNWFNLSFRMVGNKIYIRGFFPSYKTVSVEYRVLIPSFEEEDIYLDATQLDDEGYRADTDTYAVNDVDLRDYGIDSRMYEFIKLYVKGKVECEIDSNQGNNTLALAENYFADLTSYRTSYSQNRIKNVF